METKLNNPALDKKDWDESRREYIRKELDFYGDGAEVIFSHKSPVDQSEIVTDFFTSRLPKLHVGSKGTQRTIDVEMSSAEEDNQSLLHFLFNKSKGL